MAGRPQQRVPLGGGTTVARVPPRVSGSQSEGSESRPQNFTVSESSAASSAADSGPELVQPAKELVQPAKGAEEPAQAAKACDEVEGLLEASSIGAAAARIAPAGRSSGSRAPLTPFELVHRVLAEAGRALPPRGHIYAGANRRSYVAKLGSATVPGSSSPVARHGTHEAVRTNTPCRGTSVSAGCPVQQNDSILQHVMKHES